MAGEIAYKLTADEKQAIDAIRKVAESFAGVEGGIKKVSEESRRAAKAQEEFGRIAKQVMERAKEPADRYYEAMAKLDKVFEQGKVTLPAYQKEQQRLAAEWDKARDSLQKIPEANERAFGSQALEMAKGFLGAIGIETGIAGGVRLIKEEWDAVIAVQERALEATTGVAKAQHKFRTAAGVGTEAEAATLDKTIEGISEATGVSAKDLYLDAAAAMKARHGLSREKAFEAVQAAAELSPFDAGERQATAQTMMGVQQATGMGARQAGGWLIKSAEKTGATAPGIAEMINAAPGEDPRQIMAMAQAIATTTGADPTQPVLGLLGGLEKLPEEAGKTVQERLTYVRAHTKPAITQEQFDAEKKQLEDDKGKAAEEARAKEEVIRKRGIHERRHKQTHAQLEERALRDSDEHKAITAETQARQKDFALRYEALEKKKATIGVDESEALVKTMNLRGPKAKAAALQMLRGEGPAAAEYAKDLAAGVSPAEGEAAFARAVRAGGAGDVQGTANLRLRLASQKESIESSPVMQDEARRAASMEGFGHILQDVGEGAIASRIEEFGARISGDELADVFRRLRNKQKELRGPKERLGIGQTAGWFGSGGTVGPANAKELFQANQLQKVIDALDAAKQDMEAQKMVDLLEKIASGIDRNTQDRHRNVSPSLASVRGDPGDKN